MRIIHRGEITESADVQFGSPEAKRAAKLLRAKAKVMMERAYDIQARQQLVGDSQPPSPPPQALDSLDFEDTGEAVDTLAMDDDDEEYTEYDEDDYTGDEDDVISTTHTAPEPEPEKPEARSAPQSKTNTNTAPWSTLSPTEKWRTNPSLRARELGSKTAICNELQDPEYALRDAEIQAGMLALRTQMHAFSTRFFSGQVRRELVTSTPISTCNSKTGMTDVIEDISLPSSFYASLARETVKIIHCIASGGPAGESGWHAFFVDAEKRKMLVCGILGNVLVEQVLGHVFFGGSAEEVGVVREGEKVLRDEDGMFFFPCRSGGSFCCSRFVSVSGTVLIIGMDMANKTSGFSRTTHTAQTMHSFLTPSTSTTNPSTPSPLTLPSNFHSHITTIVAALSTHLVPLLSLTHPPAHTSTLLPHLIPSLQNLVTTAALLSLHMRLDPHTVYHVEPLFKEDRFDRERMECANQREMEETCPYSKDSDNSSSNRDTGVASSSTGAKVNEKEKEKERQRAEHDIPLTQMTLLNGMVAYRRGGWETASSTIQQPEYQEREWEDRGVRVRRVTRGWVWCRWGRPRGLSASTSTSGSGSAKGGSGISPRSKEEEGKRIHGPAWRKGGFVEFTALKGVLDWLGMEEAERKGAAEGR